ncbi:hypothetical protein H4J46_06785 [Colwellia sp. MB02u-6]|uniref:hypothetical protein n=1 Tax=Colwellia sp. MB02u-6 TaxID=2759824 RepID=UPI0015F52081|nr:hypothetical protein [Colwellia sp. MB02u-6]MBA6327646.1 hypothetical protein [Colwellia sp. MB02u-6]
MKLLKTRIATALIVAFAVTGSATAEDVLGDLMAKDVPGNLVIISQETLEGAELGNVTSVVQGGDMNRAQVMIVGDANAADISQEDSSYGIVNAAVNGQNNSVNVGQAGENNTLDTTITGNANQVSFSQRYSSSSIIRGAVNGDDNRIDVNSDQGDNLTDYTINGSSNRIGNYQYESGESVVTINGFNNSVHSFIAGGSVSTLIEGSFNNLWIDSHNFGQSGNNVSAVIVGDRQYVDIMQWGESNTIELSSLGNAGSSHSSFHQGGDLNTLVADVSGSYNDLNVGQDGSNNFASVIASGENTRVSFRQSGTENQANIDDLEGMGNNINAQQQGALNVLDLVASGESNSIDIRQEGSANGFTAKDGGAFQVTASLASFDLAQVGNNNLVTGVMAGANGTVSISQTGDFNVVNISQM